ncbi:sensor histidine kinase, partial [Streptomyces sp. NPDC048551]
MEQQRERPGPPWRRWVEGAGRGLGWRSALLVAVLAQVGTGWAAQAQPGRVPLDAWARILLLLGPALLLARHRHPVAVAYAVGAVTLVYLAAGYPYGPVFVSFAVACFAAVISGHRRAAWGAVALLWTGHLLIGH